MTTIISRLYKDQATAKKVVKELTSRGFPTNNVDLITGGDDAEERIAAAHVSAASAKAYASKMKGNNAVLVANAPVTPFGLAKTVIGIFDSQPSINAGVENENVYLSVTGAGRTSGSILAHHPRFFTQAPNEQTRNHGRVSDTFGIRLLSTEQRRSSVMPDGPRMSSNFWPGPLLSSRKRENSVIEGGPRMSTNFWPMPLLTSAKRTLSIRVGGGFPFSEAFNLPLLTRS